MGALEGGVVLAFFSCCSLLEGGKGGKVAGSYAGTRILELSIDGVLDEKLCEVPVDNAETDAITEDTDS